ncbi:MAG: DUF5362 family protein [Blastopirellula sp. JB062]
MQQSDEHLGLILPLVRLLRRANIVGMSLVVIGIVYCVSIIGLAIGWLPIRLGMRIRKTARQFDDAFHSKEGHLAQSYLAELDRLSRIGSLLFAMLFAVAIAAALLVWMA